MGVPIKVTDAQIVEDWKRRPSISVLAKEYCMSARRLAVRVKRLRDQGFTLNSPDCRSPNFDASMVVTADRVEVKLTLQDGVILVTGDQHFWPGVPPVSHRAFCHLARKLNPFAVIWNGDAFDGSTISRYPSIGWENKPGVKKELESVHDRSAEVMEAAPNAKRIWNAGNHDLRFETRLASVASEYKDVHGIHLKDHFPEWHPAWFVTVNEGQPSHTEIRHREKNGIHAGYNNVKESGVNMVTGHDHVAEVRPYDDRRGRRYGVRHGMGADSPRDAQFVNYLEGRKANWQSAIAILTYRDGVLLYPELALRLDDDHFQFRGEVIEV